VPYRVQNNTSACPNTKKEGAALEALVDGVVEVRFIGFDEEDSDDRLFAIHFRIDGADLVWVAEDIFVDPAGFYMD
jgi:hypothetical protein